MVGIQFALKSPHRNVSGLLEETGVVAGKPKRISISIDVIFYGEKRLKTGRFGLHHLSLPGSVLVRSRRTQDTGRYRLSHVVVVIRCLVLIGRSCQVLTLVVQVER